MKERIDWPQVLADLKAKRWTQLKIQMRTGISQATISNAKRGVDPASSTGYKLIVLWSRVTRKPIERVPLISVDSEPEQSPQTPVHQT